MEFADGRLVMRMKQPKGLKVTNPIQKQNNNVFAWCCKASIYSIDLDRIAAEFGSQGTMYLPRDILVAAMYGTLVQVTTNKGKVYRGARTLPADIQYLLDQLSDQVGAMLVRGTDAWIGIGTGAATQVLTANGPGLIPNWQDATGGGGSGYQMGAVTATGTTPNTDAYACKATQYCPNVAIDVAGVWQQTDGIPGATYSALIAPIGTNINAPTISAAPTIGPITTPSLEPSWFSWMYLPFTAPITLQAGTKYAVGSIRQDGSATTSNHVFVAESNGILMAAPGLTAQSLNMANLTPAIGDTFGFSGHQYFANAQGIHWKLH